MSPTLRSAAFIGLGQAINGIIKAPPKVPLETVNKLPTPAIVVKETVAPAMGNFIITTATGAANTAAGTITNTTKELAKAGLVDVTDNVGRKIVGAGIVNLDEVVVRAVGKGFSSFDAFKYAFGRAGDGMAWHHIVEQTKGNIAKFDSQSIQNTNNLIKLEHGSGTIHNKVSAYYSSKQFFTNGQTVRQWLSTQSFEDQFQFGVNTITTFNK